MEMKNFASVVNVSKNASERNVSIPYKGVIATDILSEEDQTELIQLRDVIRDCYFEVGDVALRNVRAGAHAVGASVVYDAVGRFVGKSERTIRYYAETASFYQPVTRREFDILPFSFFVYAKSQSGRWQEILDYAMLKPHVSLAGLKTHFLLQNGDTNSDQIYKSSGISMVDNPQGQERPSDKFPPYSSYTKMMLLSTLSDLLDRVTMVLGSFNLSADARARLVQSVRTIQSVIGEIVKKSVVDVD